MLNFKNVHSTRFTSELETQSFGSTTCYLTCLALGFRVLCSEFQLDRVPSSFFPSFLVPSSAEWVTFLPCPQVSEFRVPCSTYLIPLKKFHHITWAGHWCSLLAADPLSDTLNSELQVLHSNVKYIECTFLKFNTLLWLDRIFYSNILSTLLSAI